MGVQFKRQVCFEQSADQSFLVHVFCLWEVRPEAYTDLTSEKSQDKNVLLVTVIIDISHWSRYALVLA